VVENSDDLRRGLYVKGNYIPATAGIGGGQVKRGGGLVCPYLPILARATSSDSGVHCGEDQRSHERREPLSYINFVGPQAAYERPPLI
jgi:hypothetical protein